MECNHKWKESKPDIISVNPPRVTGTRTCNICNKTQTGTGKNMEYRVDTWSD